MKTVNNYLKNVMKSVAYAAADVSGEYVPGIKEFTETNKEFGVATYAALKNPSQFVRKQVKAMQESKVYKALDYGVRNLSEDLRTGNFYNKERKDRDELAFSGLDTNWDDLSEFGIDDDWESKLDSSSSKDEVTAGDIKIVESIEGSNAALASATVNAVITASQNEIKNSRANMAMMYSQNERLFSGLHKDMTILGSTMQQMYKLQSASLQNIDKNISSFFTQESKLSTERNAILKEMLEMQRNMYKSAADKEKETANKRKTNRIRWDDINVNGVINLDAYFGAVKKNIANELSSMMPASFGDDGNMLAVMMTSPLEGVMKYVVNGVIPATVKAATKELDGTVSGVFGNIIGALGNARSKNEGGILGTIAKFLGVSTSVNRNIDTSRYEKGPVPFDGITRKAIVDVIPTHLRRIEAAITGRQEEMFDYKAGRWVKVADVRKQFEDIKRSSIKRATSDIRSAMNPGIQTVRKGITDKGERDSWDKAVEQFEEFLYNNNGRFDPRVSASKNDIDAYTYPDLYRHYNKIKTIYKDFDKIQTKDKNGKIVNRHTRISTRMGLSRAVLDAKEAEEKQYRSIESDVGNALQSYFGFPKADEHGKPDSKGKFKAYNILNSSKDNLGNTVFDYLQNINKELTYIRSNGIFGGGGKGRYVSKKEYVSMKDVENQIKNPGLRTNNYANEEAERERIAKAALDAISSGKAIDLRDFDEDQQNYLLQLSDKLSSGAISEYKSEIIGYNENEISSFIDKHYIKTNIKTQKDVEEAIKRAEKEGKNTNEVMTDKEETFFRKIMNRIGMGESIFGGIVGASSEAFTNLLYAADKAIYEMMYKIEIDDDETKVKYNGFMDAMVGKMTDKFKVIGDKFKELVIDPFADRLGIDKDFKGRFKDSLINTGSKLWTSFKEANTSVYKPIYNNIASSITRESDIKNGTKEWDYKSTKSKEASRARRLRALAIHNGGEELAIWCEQNGFTGTLDEKKVRLGSEFGLPSAALARIKTDEDANMVFAKQYRHHAGGTPSGLPFSGLTTLTKGEGLISGMGVGIVPKTGVYNVTTPTHIINTEDMHSITGGPRVSIQSALGKEKLAAKAAGFNVSSNAKGTVKITNDGVDINTKEFLSEMKKYIPEAASGGLIGGILSLVLGTVGGPLLGAAVGAGGSILASSDTLKTKLFGKAGEDGKRDGSGIISKSVMNVFNKYFPDMAKYGLAGIIPGLLTPLGPVGGLLVGGAFGFLKNNEKFTNKYFGEEGMLHIKSKEKKIIENMLPGALKGAGIGAVTSVLFGGPFGIVGNAALGSAIGMMASTEDFKNLILGTEIDGERIGGIVGAFKDAMEPFTEALKNSSKKLIDAFDNNLIKPLANFIKPAIHALPIALGTIPRFLSNTMDKFFNTKIGGTIETWAKRIFSVPVKFGAGVLNAGSSLISGLTKIPGGLLNKAGNRLTGYNIRHGDTMDMTQREAVEWMDSHGRGDEVSSILRASSRIGSGEEGAMSKDSAQNLVNTLGLMNTNAVDAQKKFKTQKQKLNKLLSGYTSESGKKLTNKQIDAILRAARNKDYSSISNILQNRAGLTKAEFNSFMEDKGLKQAIIDIADAEFKMNNAGKISDKDLYSKAQTQLEEFGISDLDLNNKKERAKAIAMMKEQLLHLEANPEENKIELENNENAKRAADTLDNILRLMVANFSGDSAEKDKVMADVAKSLDRGKQYANEKYDKKINKALSSMGDDADNLDNMDAISNKKNMKIADLGSNIINNSEGGLDNALNAFKYSNIEAIKGLFTNDAIKVLSYLDKTDANHVIKALNNRFISRVLRDSGWQITEKTIKFLSGFTSDNKELAEKCAFLTQIYNKPNGKDIYKRFKSLEEVYDLDMNQMSKLRQEFGIDYLDTTSSTKTNIIRKLGFGYKKIKQGIKSVGNIGLKATGFLASAPFKAIGLAKNAIIDKIYGVHSDKWYDKNYHYEDKPEVEQNGIGTLLLGAGKSLLTSAGKLAGSAVKGIGSLFKKRDADGVASGKPGILSGLFGGDGLFGNSVSNSNMDEVDKAGDGKDLVHVGNGDMIQVKRSTDGSVEPDTTDSKTKTVLNKLSLKEKLATKVQEAQLKASELIKNNFDTSHIKESKGGKLGWLSLLLTGGYLWKSGILGKLFDGFIKPLWADHIKPWITDKAIPWITGTALPAIRTILGDAITGLATALPNLIASGIRGWWNKKDTEKTDIEELKKEYGSDFVTGLTDENGNALTVEQIKNRNYKKLYNSEGIETYVNENGEIVTDSANNRGTKTVNKAALDISKVAIRTNINSLASISNNKIISTVADTSGKVNSKLISGISKAIDGIFGNSRVYKLLQKAGKFLGQTDIAAWIKGLKSKLDDLCSKLAEKITKKAGSAALDAVGSFFAIATAVGDFVSGWDRAESILGITEDDTTTIHRLAAALIRTLLGLIPFASLFSDWITEVIVGIFDKDIDDAKQRAKEEYEEWKKTNNSTISLENYLAKEYSVTGSISYTVKKWANKLTGKTTEGAVTNNTSPISTGSKPKSLANNPNGKGIATAFGTGKFSKQIDPSVAGMRFNSSSDREYQTIGDSGCGPAAAVNVLESMYGRGNEVASAAKFALDRGYKETNGGTRPEFFTDYFNSNGLNARTSYNRTDIARNIASGMPTVIMGQDARGVSSATPFGRTPHYVTVTGTDGRGNAIVQDPESRYDNQLYPLKSLMKNTSLGVSAFGKKYRGKFGRGKWGRGDNAAQIWWFLKNMGMTDAGAAGLMGNLHAESGLRPNNLQNSYHNRLGSDEYYTASVDNGSYTNFTNDRAGYGLAQWTSAGRKAGLYNLAKSKGVSIADLGMQLEWLATELNSGSYRRDVLNVLKTTNSLSEASDAVLTKFEKPANQGPEVKAKRQSYGKIYLDRFGGTSGDPVSASTYTSSTSSNLSGVSGVFSTLSELGNIVSNPISQVFSLITNAFTKSSSDDTSTSTSSSIGGTANYSNASGDAARMVEIARGEVGNRESGTNNIKYNDWLWANDKTKSGSSRPWCAAFTSWLGHQAGIPTSVIPATASTRASYKALVNNGGKITNSEAKPGDFIFFTKNGTADGIYHTGLVVGHKDGIISTIEGNTEDMVAERNYDTNFGEILLARPKYPNAGSVTNYSSSVPITGAIDYNNTRGGNGIKPLSKYGQFKNSIYGTGAEARRLMHKTKDGYVKVEQSAEDRYTPQHGTGAARYGMAGPDYSKFINTIINILMTIADNTDKLNLIVKILNEKLSLNITASDVSKATSDTQSLKSQLSSALYGIGTKTSKFNTYADNIGDSSMNYIISAMNAVASA